MSIDSDSGDFDDDEIDEFGDEFSEYEDIDNSGTDLVNFKDNKSIEMFGDAPEAFSGDTAIPNTPYLVLARKYRPQRFEDLVGQEAMVKTLTNAFKQNRIAHAFMLTGVRGIGKTTTARLIARALNYSSPGHDAPSMELSISGVHCEAITQGRHPDVMELDAASRSGVDNMRELLDNVRYGPTIARYKVYIIDEVHMLSTAAFNALLKTLEEPPPHTKFIFATTETHKVPVTILSRCQRFDLRRLSRKALADHLENICNKENVKVEREGLEQISRAAEGSVRDALSLLDQAIVQDVGASDGIIKAASVRDMLGLSDRNRIHALFEFLLKGDAKNAILEMHEQYDFGAAPSNVLQSLMELSHEVAKLIILGKDYNDIQSGDGLERLKELAANSSPLALSRMWQMLNLGLEETKKAPDALAAADMCLIRICGAQSMPSPEDLVKLLNNTPENAPLGGNMGGGAPKGTVSFLNLEDMCYDLENKIGEMALVSEIEKYAKPVRLEENLFTYEPKAGCPSNLLLRIKAALRKLTGQDWSVFIEENGGQTIDEKRKEQYEKKLEEIKANPKVKGLMKLFPSAKIVNFREISDLTQHKKVS